MTCACLIWIRFEYGKEERAGVFSSSSKNMEGRRRWCLERWKGYDGSIGGDGECVKSRKTGFLLRCSSSEMSRVIFLYDFFITMYDEHKNSARHDRSPEASTTQTSIINGVHITPPSPFIPFHRICPPTTPNVGKKASSSFTNIPDKHSPHRREQQQQQPPPSS